MRAAIAKEFIQRPKAGTGCESVDQERIRRNTQCKLDMGEAYGSVAALSLGESSARLITTSKLISEACCFAECLAKNVSDSFFPPSFRSRGQS